MVKFITIRGTRALRATPYYIGIPQHERIMSRREAYELAAERTGYKATAIRAVFMALREFARENQRRGNITYIDEVASIRNYCKGAEHACEVAYSDLGNVKAQLASPLEAGTYTLAVFTRSGLVGEYGVRKATRKVKVA